VRLKVNIDQNCDDFMKIDTEGEGTTPNALAIRMLEDFLVSLLFELQRPQWSRGFFSPCACDA
jgi:hypothetical protein